MSKHFFGLIVFLLAGSGLHAQKIDVKKLKTQTFLNKRGEPQLQVKASWTVDDVVCKASPVGKQRIKGFVKRGFINENNEMETAKTTAEGVIRKATFQFQSAAPEVKAFWDKVLAAGHVDKSEHNYIADIGKHGTSTYPAFLLKFNHQKQTLEVNDTPGTTAAIGPNAFFQLGEIKLQFETTIVCDGKPVFVFEWSIDYTLPPPKGQKPKAVVTLISQKKL